MKDQDIIFSRLPSINGELGHIVLNRPKALNALSHQMIKDMHTTLIEWLQDDAIRAVIISSNNDRAFCAGGDIRQIYIDGCEKNPNICDFFRDEYTLNHLIRTYKKPYIALVNGITMGGGVGVSLHGSHRVGGAQLTFAMPETSIGFFPDVGASYFLSRLKQNSGIYLGLTGARLNAADAHYLKLIDHVVTSEAFAKIIDKLSQIDLTENASEKITGIISQYEQNDIASAAKLPERIESIDTCFAADSVDNIFSRLLAQQNAWCQQTLELLTVKSPTSLKLTLAEICRGASLPFKDCMQMEYVMVQHVLEGHDFYEGVRALLIDKDNAAKWQPATLQQIDDSEIDAYFLSTSKAVLDLNDGIKAC